jgi:hypothetical protein
LKKNSKVHLAFATTVTKRLQKLSSRKKSYTIGRLEEILSENTAAKRNYAMEVLEEADRTRGGADSQSVKVIVAVWHRFYTESSNDNNDTTPCTQKKFISYLIKYTM